MQRKASALIVAVLLLAPAVVWARAGKYLAIGVSHNLENHQIPSYAFESNAGFNARFGYIINNNITFEGNVDVTSFKHDGVPWDANSKSYSSTPSFDVTMITFDVKLSPDFRSPVFQPYAVFGLGMIISDPNESTASPSWNYSLTASADKQDIRYMQAIANLGNNAICGEIGAGFDYYLADTLSLQVETKYVRSFEDLEDVQYIKSTVGFAFHF